MNDRRRAALSWPGESNPPAGVRAAPGVGRGEPALEPGAGDSVGRERVEMLMLDGKGTGANRLVGE